MFSTLLTKYRLWRIRKAEPVRVVRDTTSYWQLSGSTVIYDKHGRRVPIVRLAASVGVQS